MCHWLTEGLIERGHDVTLIAAGRKHTSGSFVQTLYSPPTPQLGQSLPEVLHVALADRVIETGEFDIVHDHTLIGPLLAKGREIPTVVTTHGNLDGELSDYYRSLAKHIHLVAISHSQKQHAPDLPWASVVHNGIPVEEFSFSPIKEDFALFLGRMGAQKGAHLAIDAAAAAGIRLIIAAKVNEADEREYFEQTVKPRLGPEVEWIGEADTKTKKELLMKARCLLFPIQWEEPFGLVMVEALASGTPVVALRRGSVPEVIDDGLTGFICDHPDELPDAISKVGDIDPQVCRRNAEMRFDIRCMISGYERIFEAVAKVQEPTGALR